jgi:hypothetical protein
MPIRRIQAFVTPRVAAAVVAVSVLGALIAAPHVAPPRPEPFEEQPPPLSAPLPPAHNPDPAVIGPTRG